MQVAVTHADTAKGTESFLIVKVGTTEVGACDCTQQTTFR